MARLSSLLFVVLAVVTFVSVSATNMVYSVTFVSCVQGLSCPQGNPTYFNGTFALNGTLSPNISLTVGDRLEFDLAVNTSAHPLTICQNSTVPSFCKGANGTNQLTAPITTAGANISYIFTMAGTYYYGCYNHSGMGATIMVMQTSTSMVMQTSTSMVMENTTRSLSSSTKSTVIIPIIALLAFILN